MAVSQLCERECIGATGFCRWRSPGALAGLIQEAYMHGVSTRSAVELVKAMGMSGISKS